jgi:signal transduction histidine kinase
MLTQRSRLPARARLRIDAMPTFKLIGARRGLALPRSRSTVIVLVLLLTLGLAGMLAYAAQQAARSHRATAENVLRDYAAFATWEFSRATKRELSNIFSVALARLSASGETPAELPHALNAVRNGTDSCSGGPSPGTIRGVFRVDLPRGAVTETGEPLPAAVRDRLTRAYDEIRVHARNYDCPILSIAHDLNGRPVPVIWQVLWKRGGEPREILGFEAAPEFLTSAFERILRASPLLPPSLAAADRANTMLSVRVAEAAGPELFASAREWSPYSHEDTLDETFGALHVSVALRPAVANSLVIGGLPRERLPLLFGLLALTAGLIIVALVQLRRESELARLRSDFVAGVSHELRTPLAQIRMFSETLLLGRVRSPEEGQRSLEIIGRETQRLTQLVENMLYFSRAERRVPCAAATPTSLDVLVRDVVEGFEVLAQARRATVVPCIASGLTAEIDPGALRQVLLNLLDNAIKYGPEGQTVRVSVAGTEEGARITVEDEGPGIAMTDAERIWEPFWRLPRAESTSVGGSGIGLAIVRQLVRLHGGRTWAERADSGGARFVVVLPATRSASTPDVAA